MEADLKKYYQPDISEFHVGFEYELVPPIGYSIMNLNNPMEKWETKWATEFQKGVFGIKDVDPWGGLLAGIRAAIEKEKCRVKYLDKEDIESLKIPSYIKINHILNNTYEIIGTNARIFKGDIKNKSELKKLLKQLNIL